MKLLRRLLSLALATVFCIGAAVFPINASAKKTSACIQGEIPDGVYLIDGCVQREITVQNGTFEAELPPHTVSYIIF